MKKFDITTTVFYRWRYWIGYGSIVALILALLYLAGFLISSGISPSELRSIISSSQFSSGDFWNIISANTPFYLLQHGTLTLFGVTILGIKLPSLLLGFITAICMIFLLRRWFTPGIAMLASMIAITTGQFLFLTQQGSPGILYLFWPTVILLLATLVANRARFHAIWKIVLFIAVALSLYTPLSIYVIIALVSAIGLHPHLRYIIRRIPRLRIVLGMVIAIIILAPLGLAMLQDPGLSLRLLGIPSQWPDLFANFRELAGQYFGFTSLGNRSILLPVFGLSSMLIILFGLYRIIRTRETVQGYVILTWIILLLPILTINPSYISIMFVPLLLLLASGLEGILRSWYGLFPRNPYARITGLIPLVILVSSMVLFGLERFTYAYRYAPDIVHNFSSDVLILPDTPVLVVAQNEKELYESVAHYSDGLTVTVTRPESGEYAVTASAYNDQYTPSQVIATGRAENGARFYIYK